MSLAFRNSPHHALPANIPRKSLQTPPTAGRPSVPPSLPRVLPRPARPAPDDANVAPQAEASDNPATPALRFHVPLDSRPALPPRHSETQPRRSSPSMPLAPANSSPHGTPPAPARIFPTCTPVSNSPNPSALALGEISACTTMFPTRNRASCSPPAESAPNPESFIPGANKNV